MDAGVMRCPKEVEDEGLRGVWDEVRSFLTTPAKEPKDIQGFFNTLMAPPYGVRAGLLPILFGGGLKGISECIISGARGQICGRCIAICY